MEQYMWIVWLGILILGVIVEALGTELVSIWFSAGAVIALILSFIPGLPWWGELIAFFVVSIVCILALRPLAKRFLKRDVVSSNADSLIDKVGIALEDISSEDPGEMKIAGNIWHAIVPEGDAPLKKGDKGRVIRISGNKLVVLKVDEKSERN